MTSIDPEMKAFLVSKLSSWRRRSYIPQAPRLVRIEYSRATVRPSEEAIQATFSRMELLIRGMWDRDISVDASWTHSYLPRPWRQVLTCANPPQELVLPRDLFDFGRAEYTQIFRDGFRVDLPVKPDGSLFSDDLPPYAEIVYMLQTLFPGMLQLVTADENGDLYTHTVVNETWLLYEASLSWLQTVDANMASQARRRRLGLSR